MNKWRIYKRRGRAFRTSASQGNWVLHKAYDSESDANKALNLLLDRNTFLNGLKRKQIVLISPDQSPPKR